MSEISDRDRNAQLRELTARAERWIFEVVHSSPDTPIEHLNLARGRSLVTALANARGALGGRRKRSDRSRVVGERPARG